MKVRGQQLGLCLVVCVVFVVLLEVGERSSGFFDLVSDPDTGLLRYRAGATIRWGREGYGVTEIGPHGMIGNQPLTPGTQVLFLGDSLAESLQVDDDKKFTRLVQERYNQRWPQQPITTLNFAMSGVSAVQHLADMPGLRRITQPHLVVVQVSNDDFRPAVAKQPGTTQRAFLAENPDGSLSLRRAPPPGQTSLAARLKQRLIRWRLFSVYARASWRLGQLVSPNAAPAEDNATPAPVPSTASADDQQQAENQRVMRFLMARMQDECRTAGARLVFLYLARLPQLQRGHIIREESGLGTQAVAERELFLATARELGVPVWNPTARLVQFADETGRLPYGFANNQPGYGHLNPDGHSVLADFIVTELRPLLAPTH